MPGSCFFFSGHITVTDPVSFSFRVAGWEVLMRFSATLQQLSGNSVKCFSWEFLVALKANSNQHYSWHPVGPRKCLHSQCETKDHGLFASQGVHRLWELSNHIILLTQTSVNLFTDLTQFTRPWHSLSLYYAPNNIQFVSYSIMRAL